MLFSGSGTDMVIRSLRLKNYRNYDLLDMSFDPKTNILYGDNAQGKTNILEALYLSGTTKSHRGTKDRDMIQFGHDEAHLEMVVEKKGLTFQIDMHLKKNSPKGIAIDRIPIRKILMIINIFQQRIALIDDPVIIRQITQINLIKLRKLKIDKSSSSRRKI